MSANALVAKIWSFCDTLRDDGLGYNDYLEQLTYLLFLKMADENQSKYSLPKACDWTVLLKLKGGDLLHQYETILKTLSTAGGMLGKIFIGSQNKIHDSSKLRRLVLLINEENWTLTDVDIKGEIYETLLQRNAESSGAGQYFTPRPVIQAIVECIAPNPGETISDPSCGTGGFFLGALDYLNRNHLTPTQLDFLKFDAFHGWEIEKATARLCLMNLFLHGIGDLKQTPDIQVVDSLRAELQNKFDIVLANPPFGKSSSDIPTIDEKQASKDGYFLRKDFWVTTSNKQLAFLQHIVSMLKLNGRAAVILPDNVLFEGGAGESVRRYLLDNLSLHTILRLPTGIFYAHGVKANVLFFDNVKANSKFIWYYDYRTNINHTLKKNPLSYRDLADFVKCYSVGQISKRKEIWNAKNPNGRWKKFSREEVLSRDKANLDIFWIENDNLITIDELPNSDELLNDIIENLENALSNFRIMKENA